MKNLDVISGLLTTMLVMTSILDTMALTCYTTMGQETATIGCAGSCGQRNREGSITYICSNDQHANGCQYSKHGRVVTCWCNFNLCNRGLLAAWLNIVKKGELGVEPLADDVEFSSP